MKTKYPEHEKMEAVKDKSKAIGEFLEWLSDTKRLVICDSTPFDELYVVNFSDEELLAEFFNIDMNKIEKEKRQMLKQIRKNNENKNG